jgi:hypothetical protein
LPTICQFCGIRISIYFIQKEHNPPHLHAQYGEYDAEIDILTGEAIRGSLPAKEGMLVKKWIGLHADELKEMWKSQQFRKLPPLE